MVYLFTSIFFLISCVNEEVEITQINNSIDKHFVTIEQIKKIVSGESFKKFISKFNNSLKRENELNVVDFIDYKDKNQVTAFYVTRLSNNKLVLFAADDRSHTVMGITDDTYGDLNSLPDEFSYWIDGEIEAIEFARENFLEPTESIETEWLSYRLPPPSPPPTECTNEYHITKQPLLLTNWGQSDGYNNNAPYLGCSSYNGKAPVGCVATATAQVMKYFQHPTSYSWNLMPNNYATNSTSVLMSDIRDTNWYEI